MKSWPLGLKIGAGVTLVLLALVWWIGLRRSADEPVRPIRSTPRSQRVQDRLARLRDEWGGHVQRDVRVGERGVPGAPPLPRGKLAPRQPAADEPDVPAEPPMFEEEPDFEQLKQIVLSGPEVEKRLMAVMLLGTSENPDALAVLTQALKDADPDVRMAAVQMLGDFGGVEPVDAIQDALSDPDPEIRFEALGVLADIGGEGAAAAVQRALHDDDEDVRALAEGLLDLEEMYREPTPDVPAAGAADGG